MIFRIDSILQNSLDYLLAPSLRKSIEVNLGKATMHKIEQRLMERHGLGIVQAIKDFYKLDSVLREFFGSGADGIESKFMKNIINLEQSKDSSENWVVLQDQFLTKILLDSFADDHKKAILEAAMEGPIIIAEILTNCKIPPTSGYRKINHLIDNGLLIPNGFILSDEGKKIKKYQTTFSKLELYIERKNINVKIQLKSSLKDSTIFQIIPH